MFHDWIELFTKPKIQLSAWDEIKMGIPFVLLLLAIGVSIGAWGYFDEKRIK